MIFLKLFGRFLHSKCSPEFSLQHHILYINIIYSREWTAGFWAHWFSYTGKMTGIYRFRRKRWVLLEILAILVIKWFGGRARQIWMYKFWLKTEKGVLFQLRPQYREHDHKPAIIPGKGPFWRTFLVISRVDGCQSHRQNPTYPNFGSNSKKNRASLDMVSITKNVYFGGKDRFLLDFLEISRIQMVSRVCRIVLVKPNVIKDNGYSLASPSI